MTGVQLVSGIIEIMVSGISSMATALGTGISTMVSALIYNADGTGLSAFVQVATVFTAIGLPIALLGLLFRWIKSLGGHKM